MIYMVMFGNGFRTGGIIIMKELLPMVVLGKMETSQFVCFVVAAGAAAPGSAGRLTAMGTAPAAAATSLASVS
jgi:hypothetical protein